jgi:hypothetical protein
MEALPTGDRRSSPEAIKGQKAMPGTRGGDPWGIRTSHIMVARSLLFLWRRRETVDEHFSDDVCVAG